MKKLDKIRKLERSLNFINVIKITRKSNTFTEIFHSELKMKIKNKTNECHE